MFTGDRSGLWLYRALHAFGFANQPTSSHRDDGLRLSDCYITAVLRCAPPQNKPLPQELLNCRPFLLRELDLLPHLRVIIALGRIAYEGVIKAFRERAGVARPQPLRHRRRGTGTSPSSSARASSFTTTRHAPSSLTQGPEAASPITLPSFAHGVEVALTRRLTLLASYHPSQQNTFTGKLTEPMFHAIFRRAKDLLAEVP
jgi:uracil-DNA glycosylase